MSTKGANRMSESFEERYPGGVVRASESPHLQAKAEAREKATNARIRRDVARGILPADAMDRRNAELQARSEREARAQARKDEIDVAAERLRNQSHEAYIEEQARCVVEAED